MKVPAIVAALLVSFPLYAQPKKGPLAPIKDSNESASIDLSNLEFIFFCLLKIK